MKPSSHLEQKLTRARTQLLLNQPFFGTLCLRLKLVPGTRPTLATDGTRIAYNPSFVDSLTPAELQGSLAHEVLHCALGHHCRRGNRDSQLWNQAADYAINPILVKNGFTMPAGVLLDPQYDNLSAEEIYARLNKSGDSGNASNPNTGTGSGTGSQPNNQSQRGQNTPQSQGQPPPESANSDDGARAESCPCGIGEVMDAVDEDGNPASPAERSRQQHEWSIAAEQAIGMANACGNAPVDLDRPLTDSRESKQDWRAILRAFVAATTISDYRWSPPNRRHVGAGLYLPSVDRSGVGEIVIGVDTSGSIGDEELQQFAGEITAIADEAQPQAIYVVYCDAAVQFVQQFEPSETITLEPKGGGGTDFRPVFEWVEEKGLRPACLIYLTDLCCSDYPEVIPDYPVLWGTDSRRTAPSGKPFRSRWSDFGHLRAGSSPFQNIS
jgi:predicted metal-dependent peptidase